MYKPTVKPDDAYFRNVTGKADWHRLCRVDDLYSSIQQLISIVRGLEREDVEGDEFDAHHEILDNVASDLASAWRGLEPHLREWVCS